MCGICGFNFENKDLIREMCSLIQHRGPDDYGHFINSDASIGMRRLSIIDLMKGHQPQHNEDEDIWIVFNGEIFNFLELRKILEKKGHVFYTNSDTETILHAYEEWDKDCLLYLRGQFALCIYDLKKKILFLARDPIGLKPLYYYYYEEKFIFASEIKSILVHGIKRELNLDSLNYYLSFKYIPSNKTLFKNIYKLQASNYLKFDLKDKKIHIEKYNNYNFNIRKNYNITEIANELRRLIEDSVKIRLISDVPLGAFLSGGIDSSGIVGIMASIMEEPVKTFSIRFEEGAPVDESKYSRLVAEYNQTDHTEMIVKSSSYKLLPKIVWHLDDLISDAATIPLFIMAEKAKKGMTVALTGDGADELFAGYSNYYEIRKNFIGNYLPINIIKILMKYYNYIPSQVIRMGMSYLNRSKSEIERFFKGISLPDEEKINIFPYKVSNTQKIIESKLNTELDLINKIINWEINYQLPNQYNMKLDKMTMANSLEARVPFLDNNIIQWSLRIPSTLKLRGNIEKYILRLALKNYLPDQILKRKKMGFTTPINLWLRTGLKEISGELLERLMKRKELFKSKYIKTLKKYMFKTFFENRVWNFIIFELWYETFIENEGLMPLYKSF